MDLKPIIHEKKLKQKDIAEKLGVSEATISKWINGVTTVPAPMIRPLARQLGVAIEALVPTEAA